MAIGIGERKRRAMRGELSEVALELLTDRDFESVTIDEIAEAAGVSRRTFFRYFASKDDVVFAFLDEWAQRFAKAIIERPTDEDPVTAVQRSFQLLTAAYQHRSLALVRLVQQTPSLRSQERINREHLRQAVVGAIRLRLGVKDERDMRPQVLATVAFAPLDAAMLSWFGSRSTENIGALLDEALATFNAELAAICQAKLSARKGPGRAKTRPDR